MRNLILLLLVIAAGVLIYHFFTGSEPARTASPGATAEQKFASLLQNGQVSAAELAGLCGRYPELAHRYLPNSLLKLEGTIHSLHLTGVGKNILEIQFDPAAQKSVWLRLDLRKYDNLLVSRDSARNARYEILGYEALMFAPEFGREGKVIYRIGQRIVERGRFFGFGAAGVCFDGE
jgi:hypothetical protein